MYIWCLDIDICTYKLAYRMQMPTIENKNRFVRTHNLSISTEHDLTHVVIAQWPDLTWTHHFQSSCNFDQLEARGYCKCRREPPLFTRLIGEQRMGSIWLLQMWGLNPYSGKIIRTFHIVRSFLDFRYSYFTIWRQIPIMEAPTDLLANDILSQKSSIGTVGLSTATSRYRNYSRAVV